MYKIIRNVSKQFNFEKTITPTCNKKESIRLRKEIPILYLTYLKYKLLNDFTYNVE